MVVHSYQGLSGGTGGGVSSDRVFYLWFSL